MGLCFTANFRDEQGLNRFETHNFVSYFTTMIARKYLFGGRVQGVGFRYATKQIAKGFDVCGSVKNPVSYTHLTLPTTPYV